MKWFISILYKMTFLFIAVEYFKNMYAVILNSELQRDKDKVRRS